ncbi:MAG: hypothetical protein ACPGUC_07405, partial [Gammaproteobacteria bacterium]
MNVSVFRTLTLFVGLTLPTLGHAAALINSTSILNDPVSTTNLWAYSAVDSTYLVIPNSTASATSTSQFASAIFRGYVSGDVGYTQDNFSNNVGDSKTIHTFATWLVSDRDQTIQLLFGGDDGHSLFVDDVFAGGAGFGVNVIVDIEMLANEAIHLELVGFNNSGTWGFAIRDNVNTQLVENMDGIRMDAVGAFVPAPATGALLLLG